MSFTSTVKNEISNLKTIEIEKISELSAMVYNLGEFSSGIKITSENENVAKRIFNLIKELFIVNAKITVRRGYNFNKKYLYILEINSKVNYILDKLCIDNEKNSLPKQYMYDGEELQRAYLRGVFLSVGSVNDPKKARYHLEFIFENENYANFIRNLLNQFSLNSKLLKRDNKYMVYIKEAEKISDFLRIIQANKALFYYEDIRIYRDRKNLTNRLNNCEQANVDKQFFSASQHIREIMQIKKLGLFDLLDEKTKETAKYRLKYPDVSLAELADIISHETNNRITKSGLHHRFEKIKKVLLDNSDK